MAEEIGLSNAAPTAWRKGAVPKSSTLEKIAQHFNVSTDYLLGKEQKETPTLPEGERDYVKMLDAFSKADESTREAILLLLKLK